MLKKIRKFIQSGDFAIYFSIFALLIIFALVYITYIKPTL